MREQAHAGEGLTVSRRLCLASLSAQLTVAGSRSPSTPAAPGNDVREGVGVGIAADSSRYDGQWVDDMLNGQGKEVKAGRAIYSGQFLDGKPHGKGTRQIPRGAAG